MQSENEILYDTLTRTLHLNPRVGNCIDNFEEIMGEHGLGEEELRVNFELCVEATMLSHNDYQKWQSPYGRTQSHIIHF